MSPHECALPPDLVEIPFTGPELALIGQAYAAAAFWHRNQWRRSGDPYVTHCVAVARILADMGMDATTVCAGLLHDVLADTECSSGVLLAAFGEEVAATVREVMELDTLRITSPTTVLEAAEPRALAVKLADRLHNMQTIAFVNPDKQQRKSQETLDVFAPLAAHLGLHVVSHQLSGLALATIDGARTIAAPRFTHEVRLLGALLSGMSALLPSASRTHWVEEWTAELHVVPRRRDRASFTAHLLLGMPKLAVTLRRTQQ